VSSSGRSQSDANLAEETQVQEEDNVLWSVSGVSGVQLALTRRLKRGEVRGRTGTGNPGERTCR